MSKGWKTFAIWSLLILLFFAFYSLFSRRDSRSQEWHSAEAFQTDMEGEQIASVTPEGGSLLVTKEDGSQYRVRVKVDVPLWKNLASHGVRIEPPMASDSSGWSSFLSSWLPLLLVALGFVFLLRRMGGGQNVFAIRKTTARLLTKPPAVNFGNVGGAAEAKERLGDVVDFLKRPRVWEAAGAHLPNGVLVEGPPGSGKTLLARALAGEARVPFFEVSAPEFVELFVGVGAARVRDLFEQAAKKVPSVVFIDELDAVGRRRGAGAISAGHQEREQTLNQLLVSLDGFQKRTGVVVIAATNRADILDAALLRPGRFDIRLKMPPLSEEGRTEVLAIHLKGKPLGSPVEAAALAKQTEGYSGAELEHLVNEAAIHAVRRSGRTVQGVVTIEDEDFRSILAAQAKRREEFNQLDAVLIESGSQLVRPNGTLFLRATLDDGSAVSGELLWADERFLKLKGPDGAAIALAKQSIARIETLAGSAAARVEEIREDRWARVIPDSV
jgi:cell division protease FtsH